jgi:UDP-N-acetyl-D-galactosamine dehydrogenase
VAEAKREYGVEMTDTPEAHRYDAVVVAVAHEVFRQESIADNYGKSENVIFDVKGILPRIHKALRL